MWHKKKKTKRNPAPVGTKPFYMNMESDLFDVLEQATAEDTFFDRPGNKGGYINKLLRWRFERQGILKKPQK